MADDRYAGTAPQADELLGRRIAGYVLDEVIGTGGMGAIYGATSRHVKKRAAVKVLLGEYTEDSEVVGRFLQEAFVASAVDHPNVIEIWAADRFEEDGRMYILMPLIGGSSLEELCVQAGPLGLEAAAAIAIQIAAGLDAVHDLGVVHRDIKPANILLTKKLGLEHFVTIVDFGVARLRAPHRVGAPATTRQTLNNVVIGTAGTIAPEQAAGSRDVDARADIYSWGVVLYRMVTGQMPHRTGTARRADACDGERFPRPRALRPDLPRAWEEVILAALEIDRNRRPGSMKEAAKRIAAPLPRGATMLTALGPNLLSAARRPTGEQPAAQIAPWSAMPPPGARRSRVLPVVIALAAIGGIAAGIVGSQLDGCAGRGAPAPDDPVSARPGR
jgi:serine/threonine-protein kinase